MKVPASRFAFTISTLGFCASSCGTPTAPVSDAGTDAEAIAPSPIVPFQPVAPLTEYVDVFTGTGGLTYTDIGSLSPAAQLPFGAVRVGPDTQPEVGAPAPFLHCAGYAYNDPFIAGFSHTRLSGAGITDLGAIRLLPVGQLETSYATDTGLRTRYTKASEQGSPGYYSVLLDRHNIPVELTATAHVGVHRYQMPAGPSNVVLDLAHAIVGVELTEANFAFDREQNRVTGSVRVNGAYSGRGGGVVYYFAIQSSLPIENTGTLRSDGISSVDQSATEDLVAYLEFATGDSPRSLELQVAISQVDLEGAIANLSEVGASNFDDIRSQAQATWEEHLSHVRITSRSLADARLFYTSLYHALSMPTLASDVDGRYRGLDGNIHQADFRYYTDFSLWDTYRTLHPLLTLIYPDIQLDMLHSLTAMAAQRGLFPRWPIGTVESGGMLGDPAAIVLADSVVKGLTDFDIAVAVARLTVSATSNPGGGRGAMDEYQSLGFVSNANGWSSSRTMEYAYADDALARLQNHLGQDSTAMLARRRHYRNVFDSASGFFTGRSADGIFDPASPTRWSEPFAEGTAWQYLWLAPHDLDGLAETLGGVPRTTERLAYFFERSVVEANAILPDYYWQGNEPDIHAPWMFSWYGYREDASRWVDWVRSTKYSLGPDGLPGNDDSGTMSAWYVWASLGLYPLAGSDQYLVAAPSLLSAEVQTGNGHVLRITSVASFEEDRITRGLTVNGVVTGSGVLRHSDLHQPESSLSFELQSGPSTTFVVGAN